MNSVDNRFLRQQSVKTGLCAYLQSFPLRFNSFVPEASDGIETAEDGLTTTRTIGRGILSDVVESTLGAAVVSGGFQMALEAGVKLDLCFGGPVPWKDRPSAQKMLSIEPVGVAPALRFIEEAIGYKIKTQGVLFVQALTHRSYPGEGQCYEREEYLGDGKVTTLSLSHPLKLTNLSSSQLSSITGARLDSSLSQFRRPLDSSLSVVRCSSQTPFSPSSSFANFAFTNRSCTTLRYSKRRSGKLPSMPRRSITRSVSKAI